MHNNLERERESRTWIEGSLLSLVPISVEGIAILLFMNSNN